MRNLRKLKTGSLEGGEDIRVSFWIEHDRTLNGIYTDPEISLSHDLYRGMPRWFNHYLAFFQRRAIERFINKIGVKRISKVLDLGCGTGRWTKLFLSQGKKAVGIDIGFLALKTAGRLSPEGLFTINLLPDISFRANSFNLAISVTVLQMLPYKQQVECLENVQRVLEPGGHLILCEASDEDDPSFYIFANSFDKWVNLCESVGFELIDQTGCEFISHVKTFHWLRGLLSRSIKTEHLRVANISSYLSKHWLLALLVRIALGITFPFEYLAGIFLPGKYARLACLLLKKKS